MLKVHSAVASLLVIASAIADLPPAFSDLKLDAAKKQVEGTDKLVLVKFTADWCGPCKAMDKTTWQDEKVVAWVKDHGVAIQVDVDKDQKIAGDFQIAAMPTMVMLRGGNEISRKVGYMDGARTLKWMEDASTGKATAETPGAPEPSGGVQERMQGAREMSQSGKPNEATKEFVWLWQHMLERQPSMVGVRGSFMANDMRALAARHAPAKEAFTKLRDEVDAKLKTEDRTFADLDDWIVLNRIIGDEDRTLAWFDRIKADADAAETLSRESFRIEPILVEKGRWSEVPLIYPDPSGALQDQQRISEYMAEMDKEHKKLPDNLDEKTKQDLLDQPWEPFRERTAVLYVGYLAAGKDDEAAAIMEEARGLYDKPRLITGVVGFAVKQGQARESQRALLDEAEKKGANVKELRASLEKALEKKR